MAVLTVLIADDHLLLRETLVQFLNRQDGFLVSSAGNMPEAMAQITDHGPFDIVLLDVVMPGMNGLAGVEAAVSANLGGSVVLMSGAPQRKLVDDAIKKGARGFVPKTLSAEALAEVLRLIHSGKIYLPIDHYSQDTTTNSIRQLAPLSPQETRVLRYLCQGMSNKEIAREMDLTEITIKTHMRSVCSKLEARNRTHAALIGNTYFND